MNQIPKPNIPKKQDGKTSIISYPMISLLQIKPQEQQEQHKKSDPKRVDPKVQLYDNNNNMNNNPPQSILHAASGIVNGGISNKMHFYGENAKKDVVQQIHEGRNENMEGHKSNS
ncbi:MAG: hypothetical protein EZS28_046026 [Streblomastix strix]|uniref:Uncharacterized protein n=1 Tax=Streblomastix strix TaxID=222440 RepID=A0A5J4TJJ5_9EUKA|nr:MAG: hypothetical protein EZS28_046026 [Streblomastix strix]